VDLSGHTGQRRLDLFALRPAGTQLGWLGYPGPYSWPGVDWRISDTIVDPPGEAGFGDAIIRLDRTPLSYPPPEAAPRPLPEPGRLTFGSFNNLAKLDDATLAFWAQLLSAFPTATLLLKGKGAEDLAVAARLDRAFGAARNRVVAAGWTKTQTDHLAQYARIDVALDPLAYNGTTTTCEALACGTPVLSRRGDRPAGRMGDSLLASADLHEWLRGDAADAIAFLKEVQPEPDRVRHRMAASALCDQAGFVDQFAEALLSSTLPAGG